MIEIVTEDGILDAIRQVDIPMNVIPSMMVTEEGTQPGIRLDIQTMGIIMGLLVDIQVIIPDQDIRAIKSYHDRWEGRFPADCRLMTDIQ